MKRLFIFGVLLFAVIISGCIFDSDNDKKADTAKKGSVSGTVKLTVSGDPVSGIKVYLMNANASVDSTNVESIRSRSAFIDSAVTDATGKYSITNISAGRYGVTPVNEDTTVVYAFTQSASSDSCVFSMNGSAISVDFTAEKKDNSGIIYEDADLIHDTITINNFDKYKDKGTVSYTTFRRSWILFVPYLDENPYGNMVSNGCGFFYYPGYSLGVYTLDNCIFYEITTTNPTKVHKFTIYHSLYTPAGSKFTYTFDLDTDTLTETK